MKTRSLLTAAIAVTVSAAMSAATPAHASLVGDSLDISVVHTGVAGGLVGTASLTHTYGGLPSTFTHNLFGTFLIASPATAPGFDNALLVDFSTFGYTGFANSAGTIVISDLAEDVEADSVAIFAGVTGMGPNIASGVLTDSDTLTATWAANSIITPGASPDAMVVAWNSAPVPAPGALALLGAAGLVAGTRRRHAKQS